jgi:sigma54-dependent transcription regulator
MNLTRRDMIRLMTAAPAAAWFNNYRALAAPAVQMVKITESKRWDSTTWAMDVSSVSIRTRAWRDMARREFRPAPHGNAFQ